MAINKLCIKYEGIEVLLTKNLERSLPFFYFIFLFSYFFYFIIVTIYKFCGCVGKGGVGSDLQICLHSTRKNLSFDNHISDFFFLNIGKFIIDKTAPNGPLNPYQNSIVSCNESICKISAQRLKKICLEFHAV